MNRWSTKRSQNKSTSRCLWSKTCYNKNSHWLPIPKRQKVEGRLTLIGVEGKDCLKHQPRRLKVENRPTVLVGSQHDVREGLSSSTELNTGLHCLIFEVAESVIASALTLACP